MSYSAESVKTPLTVLDLLAMKQAGEKIACLTAYDASFSFLIDQAGIEVILVGDSLGMVIQGKTTTIPVSMDEMVYHTRCVVQARQRALVIADLPFLSYTTMEAALKHSAKLMQSAGAQMVKLEGARIEIIKGLVDFGVPVCAHLGLLPQSINQLGRYKVQGRNLKEAESIIADALRIEQAGASLVVLECVPAELAATISQQLKIPVIGIGAGAEVDGQVLVIHDMLGITTEFSPRFLRRYHNLSEEIQNAVKQYIKDVKSRDFPNENEQY